MSILIPTLTIGAMGLLFGLLLAYASKRFAVQSDERVGQVRALLPGANCSGCGLPSCDAFAAALVAGNADVNSCAVSTADNRRKIGAMLGMEVVDTVPSASTVLCQGDEDICPPRITYEGLKTCQAASRIAGGTKGCEQACLGLGDCIRACAFDAIALKDGIVRIDPNKCTVCGKCVEVCPRSVLRILPIKRSARVLCRTKLAPRDARKICKKACIKCQLCVRNCPEDAISMVDGQIVVNQERCTACGICETKCPTGAIVVSGSTAEGENDTV